MSPKALLEEEIAEVKALCDRHAEESGQIIDDLHKNEKLDRANDRMRSGVIKHLLDALKCQHMNDETGVNNNIHAALQKISEQEQVDLQDDLPRIDALLKISMMQTSFLKSSERLRDLNAKLNPSRQRSQSQENTNEPSA